MKSKEWKRIKQKSYFALVTSEAGQSLHVDLVRILIDITTSVLSTSNLI